MRMLKGLPRALGGLMSMVLVALLALIIAPVTAVTGARAAEAPAKAWKNITMIYTTDIKGKIEPCG